MQKIVTLFKDSAGEFKKTKSLVEIAMFLAVAVVLGFFAVQVTDSLRLSFAFVANEMIGLLFGPVVGIVSGGLADILKYIVHPTGAFFPGFTITGMVSGLIFGLVLYKKPLTWKRVIVANALEMIVSSLILNTIWIMLLYGSAFKVIFPARVVAQLIQFPIHVVVFYSVARIFIQIRKYQFNESKECSK